MTIKTGEVGESLLQLWAGQASITANPARRDEFGWDYCLQIRREGVPVARVPLDRLAPELTCMVQVKTTAVGATSVDVTLANWQRMIKDPLPWFFVCIALSADGEPESVNVVHIDDAWTGLVLRRLRELALEDNVQLNHRTLRLSWDESSAIGQPFGQALRARLQDAVGNLTEYTKKKASALQNLGYENGRYEVTLSPAIGNSPEDARLAVDFAIGLVEKLPIEAFSVKDVRFDLPYVEEELAGIDGYMQFSKLPSVGESRITFSNARKTRTVVVSCETYIPTLLFPELAEEFFRVRFSAPLMSIVTTPGTLGMTIKWEIPHEQEPVRLKDLATVSAILTLLASSTPENYATVAYEKDGEVIEIAYCDQPADPRAAAKELARAAEDAYWLASWFGLPDEIMVVPAALHKGGARVTLLRRALEQRADDQMNVSIALEEDPNPEGKRVGIVVPMPAKIGDRIVAAAAIAIGSAVWDRATKQLTIPDARIRVQQTWVVALSDWGEFDLQSKIDSVGRAASTEFDLVLGVSDI